jgi:hypothetical protein
VDILDMPLQLFDHALSRERRLAREARLEALTSALTVFPNWGVASTLLAGEEPSCSTCSGIDALVAAGIVPLVEITPRAAHYPVEELAATFGHLAEGWKKHKVAIKPLQALIGILTPLADPKPKGLLRGFIDKVHDRQMRQHPTSGGI